MPERELRYHVDSDLSQASSLDSLDRSSTPILTGERAELCLKLNYVGVALPVGLLKKEVTCCPEFDRASCRSHPTEHLSRSSDCLSARHSRSHHDCCPEFDRAIWPGSCSSSWSVEEEAEFGV